MTTSLQQIQNTDSDKKTLLSLSPDQELTEIEKNYSIHALRIFKDRYLLKDNDGRIVERLDDLFERVAVAAGIMEVLYLEQFYDKRHTQKVNNTELANLAKRLGTYEESNRTLDYKVLYATGRRLGDYFYMNPFHLESLLTRYVELMKDGYMKKPFGDIIAFLEDDKKNGQIIATIQKYYDLMALGIFLPNTPCLMNAGTKLGQSAACFTLRMEDSIDGIGKTNWDIMKVFKSGGGIGINYSELREKGAYVKSTGGASSGAISYLKIVDAITGTVAQGGKRRGASMGILNVDHPEIKEFITLKDNKTLHNHNISICMDNDFMNAFMSGNQYTKDLMDMITANVWKTGDPGMVYKENMNSNNLLKPVFNNEDIVVTNPCSEISMYPYDSCILASINLSKFINPIDNKFDIEEFINVTRTVTQFLDNIVDANKYPIPEINEMTKKGRRIGVGYMGLADALTMLDIPYNSSEGFLFCEYVTAVMTMASLVESNKQAKQKGAFPLWYDEKYPKDKLPVNALYNKEYTDELKNNIESLSKYFTYRFTEDKDLYDVIVACRNVLEKNNGYRNCSTTTVAPTGTLAMLADCSSGIEPNFSNAFIKKVTLGEFEYVNTYLLERLKQHKLDQPEHIHNIVVTHNGNIQEIIWIPSEIKRVFVTAMDIHPFDHIMMQARAQRWITNGISKSINAPFDISPQMIEQIYILAWALGCKGTTIYRDGSKDIQVLNNNSIDRQKKSNLVATEYTYNYIKTMEQIPEQYTQRLLKSCNSIDSNVPTAFKKEDKIKVSCTYCHSENAFIPNGSASCWICRTCGNSIGSCI